MTFEKKVYTMEDNVKSIAFSLKDLVNQLETINSSISQLGSSSPKKEGDEKEIPF